MTEHSFTFVDGLMTVQVAVRGPVDERLISLVLDTGAAHTHIDPEIIEEIGFSARDGYRIAETHSIAGVQYGYRLRLSQLEALGFAIRDFPVTVQPIDERVNIQGLLGLDFLRRFNFEVRPREQKIRLQVA